MHLALFDFDGTLTQRDSFLEFIVFAVGWPRVLVGAVLLTPWLLGYVLGLIGNGPAKERVIRHFFAGWDREAFGRTALAFARSRLPALLRPDAMARFRWHREQAHRLLVISASLEDYLGPWCEAEGVEMIGTRLEVHGDRLTGRLATPNCYGPEKVRRLRDRLDPAAFARIYAYGDSRGDREMLALAHEPYLGTFPPPPPSHGREPAVPS